MENMRIEISFCNSDYDDNFEHWTYCDSIDEAMRELQWMKENLNFFCNMEEK